MWQGTRKIQTLESIDASVNIVQTAKGEGGAEVS